MKRLFRVVWLFKDCWLLPEIFFNITSGQSNLTYGCIATTHKRFNRIHTCAALCWVTLSISTAGHVLCWPFSPSKLPLHEWRSGSQSDTWFPGPPEFTCQMASRSAQPFCKAHGHDYINSIEDRPTNRPSYSICSHRSHLANNEMHSNNDYHF